MPRASLAKGTNILPVKWVFKIKTDEHGDVTLLRSVLAMAAYRC